MSNGLRLWPLVFRYGGIVNGNGFIAKVEAVNRILAEENDTGEIWLNGAAPGGLAAGGPNLQSASRAYQDLFSNYLSDAAEEAETFEAYRAEMDRFLLDRDRLVHDVWAMQWKASQEGQLDCAGVEIDSLPRLTGGDTSARMDVQHLVSSASQQPAPAPDADAFEYTAQHGMAA